MLVLGNMQVLKYITSKVIYQGFSNNIKEWVGGGGKFLLQWAGLGDRKFFLGGTFLSGGGNLRRSDFDHSNLFQS